MTETAGNKGAGSREERLKAALRANLQKRKLRDRDAPEASPESGDDETPVVSASREHAP